MKTLEDSALQTIATSRFIKHGVFSKIEKLSG